MTSLRFHLDFVSPYAYVGWAHAKRLAAAYQRELEPVPVVFGALLGAHGTRGPAEVPAKRAYVVKDAYRKARRAGLPIAPPPTHPFHTIASLRVASVPAEPELRHRVIDALFTATWVGGGGVETMEQIRAALEAAAIEPDEILATAVTQENKDRLRAATEEAIAAGVFGVPTVLVDGELFWGVDSFDALGDHLAGREHVPHELLERWASIAPSATRE